MALKENPDILEDVFKKYQEKGLFKNDKNSVIYLNSLNSFFCARLARLYEACKYKNKQRSKLKEALDKYNKNNSLALVQRASLELEENDLCYAKEHFKKAFFSWG